MVPALLKQAMLGQCDGDPLAWLRVWPMCGWVLFLQPGICMSQNNYVSVGIQFSFPCFQHKYDIFSAFCN